MFDARRLKCLESLLLNLEVCPLRASQYDTFNTAAAGLAKKGGRFKHFKGIATLESISDLRETPDRVILTILDGMGLLESNQRQRLESCLDMRIQASHPGDADITMLNLESLFSDLSTLVFKNPKLAV